MELVSAFETYHSATAKSSHSRASREACELSCAKAALIYDRDN